MRPHRKQGPWKSRSIFDQTRSRPGPSESVLATLHSATHDALSVVRPVTLTEVQICVDGYKPPSGGLQL
jgi:hypothetical protein